MTAFRVNGVGREDSGALDLVGGVGVELERSMAEDATRVEVSVPAVNELACAPRVVAADFTESAGARQVVEIPLPSGSVLLSASWETLSAFDASPALLTAGTSGEPERLAGGLDVRSGAGVLLQGAPVLAQSFLARLVTVGAGSSGRLRLIVVYAVPRTVAVRREPAAGVASSPAAEPEPEQGRWARVRAGLRSTR